MDSSPAALIQLASPPGLGRMRPGSRHPVEPQGDRELMGARRRHGDRPLTLLPLDRGEAVSGRSVLRIPHTERLDEPAGSVSDCNGWSEPGAQPATRDDAMELLELAAIQPRDPRPSPFDGQRRDAIDQRAPREDRLAALRDSKIRESRENALERHADLHLREIRAEAVMRPEAEREVFVGRAVDPE